MIVDVSTDDLKKVFNEDICEIDQNTDLWKKKLKFLPTKKMEGRLKASTRKSQKFECLSIQKFPNVENNS